MRELDKRPVDAAALAKLEGLYRETFIPRLAEKAAIQVDLPRLLPGEPGGRILQALDIAGNPHPFEQGQLLTDAGDDVAYSIAHRRFHEIYTQVAKRSNLEDLMLVDGATLRVVYTFQKTVERGTNLGDGPYANTNLSAAVRQILKSADRSAVLLADFELYRPNLGKSAAFLCAPVFEGATPAGVIVFQLPIDNIIRLMTAN